MRVKTENRWRSIPQRFAVRLVAAMLVVALPLMIVLALELTKGASSSLTTSAQLKGEACPAAPPCDSRTGSPSDRTT